MATNDLPVAVTLAASLMDAGTARQGRANAAATVMARRGSGGGVFAGIFGTETIERFLTAQTNQFANHATIVKVLPLLAEWFARQRLDARARVEGLHNDGKAHRVVAEGRGLRPPAPLLRDLSYVAWGPSHPVGSQGMSREDRQCGSEYQTAGYRGDGFSSVCASDIRQDIGKEGRGFKIGKQAEPAAPE